MKFQSVILSLLSTSIGLLGNIQPLKASTFSSLSDITNQTSPWLFIGTGAENDGFTPEGKFNQGVGDAVDISNFEIGAIKSPVPANNGSPFGDGRDWGPDLVFEGNIPNIPGVTIDVGPFVGGGNIQGVLPDDRVITFDGQVAITHIDGNNANNAGGFGVSNTGVFAKNQVNGGPIPNSLPAGIVCAGKANDDTSNGGCIQNNSNSFFNDEQFPNPTTSPDGPGSDSSLQDPSKFLTGDEAKESTPANNGITGEFDFTDLRTALDLALDDSALGISNLAGTTPLSCLLEDDNNGSFQDVCNGSSTINLASTGGQIKGDDLVDPTNLYVKLSDGLNIIDFNTAGNDLLLNNANIIIDGSEDASAIFRVPTDSKFNINQGNILIGDMGIMDMNVMFFSDTEGDASVFEFNDTIFNGVAFWTLGDGSGSNVNNSQGCVQYVGDKLNFQNIRYSQCSFKQGEPDESLEIPEPSAILGSMFAIGVGLFSNKRKK